MRSRKHNAFIRKIRAYYARHKRNFPWRETKDPYRILISEIMLQQTQTGRVREKYRAFLKKFPTLRALASTRTGDVIREWQGLGYNRRAISLKQAAEIIVRDMKGEFPKDRDSLIRLPGIGQSTAGAVLAFAWGIPVPFIETNIRRVYIHEFFPGKKSVNDQEILREIEETLDRKDPRNWYYALMDYGASLPKAVKNPNLRARAYKKQSPFEGSVRQVRGAILRTVLQAKGISTAEIKRKTGNSPYFMRALRALEKEGFLEVSRGKVRMK